MNNYSFDGVYFHAKKKTSMDDPLRYWRISAGKIESGNEDALSANSKYARLTVRPGTKLKNLVYNGGVNQDRCAMYIAPGKTYQFRCWLRSDSFAGSVCVHVANSQNKPCDYPFSFGLSYTTFQIDQPELIEVGDDHAQVAVSVTNTGRRAGAEVVQFYAAYPDCPADHPVRTLCDFKKVFLESGERKTVTIRVLLRIHSFIQFLHNFD